MISDERLHEGASPETTDAANTTLRLAMRPREASKALGIGERLLWSLTNRGEIPHLRVGKAVLYPIADLERWLSEQAKRKGGNRR